MLNKLLTCGKKKRTGIISSGLLGWDSVALCILRKIVDREKNKRSQRLESVNVSLSDIEIL